MTERNKKRVVIARHGQSTANESGVHEGRSAVLTTTGFLQAAMVAGEFERRGVKALMSSGEPRAIQSVHPASARLGLTPDVNELFNERRRPSHTIGLHADDSIARHTMGLVDAGSRFSDEESVKELLTRGYQIFQLLAAHPSDCIGIFSHAHLLRALTAIVTNRFDAGEREYRLLYDTARIDNGGICIFEYGPAHKSTEWWWHLVSWNETGHLHQ